MSWTKKLAWANDSVSWNSFGNSYSSEISYNSGVGQEYTWTYVTACYQYKKTISDTADVSKLEISISLDSTAGAVAVGVLASPATSGLSYQTVYSLASAVSATWTIGAGENLITVTDKDTIAKILSNGIGLRSASSGTSWKSGVYATATCTYTDTEEAPAVRSAAAPESAYAGDGIALSWEYTQSANIAQTAVDISLFTKIADADAGTETESEAYRIADHVETVASSMTVPLDALTLSSNTTYTLKIRAYAANGTASDWYTVGDVEIRLTLAELLSPIGGENVLATETIRLRWRKSSDTPSVSLPARFVLGISENAGETWEDRTIDGQEAETDGDGWVYEIQPDTLSAGLKRWRVVIWDTENAANASGAAKETFVAVINAETSDVTCDGKPRPTVTWSANAQVASQVQFDDFDSGAVYGTATSYTVPRIFPDGLHSVRVRTQASTGAWSDWTDWNYVQITNVSPTGSVLLTAEKTRNAVSVKWESTESFAWYILYRNGEAVYGGAKSTFLDVGGNGDCTYFVRALDGGNYVQSNSATVDARPECDVLYDESTGQWTQLRRAAAHRRHYSSKKQNVTYKHYAGRSYPVAFVTEEQERTWTIVCASASRDLSDTLEEMTGRELLYKTKSGTAIYGILDSVAVAHEVIYEIHCTLTEIDHREVVSYAAE